MELVVHILVRSLAIMAGGHREFYSQFLVKKLIDGGAIPNVDPVAARSILLVRLRVAEDDIVVALGARSGRGEPDLLVRWLLVDDIGARGATVQRDDAGLGGCHLLVGRVTLSGQE